MFPKNIPRLFPVYTFHEHPNVCLPRHDDTDVGDEGEKLELDDDADQTAPSHVGGVGQRRVYGCCEYRNFCQ